MQGLQGQGAAALQDDDAQMLRNTQLSADEVIRRFLLHVLPSGFHRIRHYGLIANGERKENLARARALLGVTPSTDARSAEPDTSIQPVQPTFVCPHCGAAMIIIDAIARGQHRALVGSPIWTRTKYFSTGIIWLIL